MRPYWFSSVDALVPFARLRAERGIYNGKDSAYNRSLIALCSHVLTLSPETEATVIYTKDAGHHMNGWWKNPDYERCLHISIGYRAPRARQYLPQDKVKSLEIARAFFGDDARLCWVERPYTDEGKKCDVWHYRLFCDSAWKPMLPKGEVYSKDNTPPGWKSFSELFGFNPTEDQAPFLLAGGNQT